MSFALRASIWILLTCAVTAVPKPAVADEGGVSFWIPGLFGSLAAAPQQPGWSFTTFFYNTDVRAGADVAFARQIHRGQFRKYRHQLQERHRHAPRLGRVAVRDQ